MTEKQSSFVDITLGKFKENNSHAFISVEGDDVLIEKPWGELDCRLSIKITDVQTLNDLNEIIINPRFDAIIHIDSSAVEFLFGYLGPKVLADYGNRRFNFNFKGSTYDCHFAPPSPRLLRLAKAYQAKPSTNTVRQMRELSDGQKIEELSSRNQEYFKEREPRSFSIRNIPNVFDIRLPELARTLNFYAKYYDDHAPEIIIRHESPNAEEIVPVRFISADFPSNIVARELDEVILQLLTVARDAGVRYSILYCYQVFEYASYAYLDEKMRRNVEQILRNPRVIECSPETIGALVAAMSEGHQNDEVKMRRVIEQCCDPKVLWVEIENDRQFFSNKTAFDGGFELLPLISENENYENFEKNWPRIIESITKVRNCLVHAREKREYRVILPSIANNLKLRRLQPLVLRMASQVALGA